MFFDRQTEQLETIPFKAAHTDIVHIRPEPPPPPTGGP